MKLLVFLATLTLAFAADKPPEAPAISADHQQSYFIAGIARASAESQLNDLLSDAARKAREGLKAAAEQERQLFLPMVKDCGDKFHPQYAAPATPGALPTHMECVLNTPPPARP